MQALADYIRTLAVFMVFSALVDIISPSSSFKSYINLILGLMLIAFMLEPLANLLHNTNSYLSQAYEKYQHIADKGALRESNEMIERENSLRIISEYKSRLNEQIKGFVLEQSRTVVEECDVVVNEDNKSKEFGELYGIHLTVNISYDEPENKTIQTIAFGNQSKALTEEQAKENIVQSIKNSLRDFYNIGEGNIHITVR